MTHAMITTALDADYRRYLEHQAPEREGLGTWAEREAFDVTIKAEGTLYGYNTTRPLGVAPLHREALAEALTTWLDTMEQAQ